jgi:hypothetical protein
MLAAAFVTAALAIAGLAFAAGGKPTIEQFSFVGVDTGASGDLSAQCGFDVIANVNAHETHLFFPDGSEQDLIHYQAAYVVGGETKLIEDDNFRLLATASSVTVSGQDFRLLTPDGATILKNRGNLNFNFDTNSLTFHGPHPSITDGFDICAALAA